MWSRPGAGGMVGPRTLPAISPETLGRAALRLLKAEALVAFPRQIGPLWSLARFERNCCCNCGGCRRTSFAPLCQARTTRW